MPRINWDDPNARKYETGVDRGVLYPDGGTPVPWIGLVSVDEQIVGGERTEYHFDGIKYLDHVGTKIYQANLSAYMAPAEFGPCVGEQSLIPGFIFTRQQKTRFGLCYRTLIDGGPHYKIHIVYNATATPGSRSYQTVGAEVAPGTRDWTIDAVPPASTGHTPTAHYIIDSSKCSVADLTATENELYGTATTVPKIPLLSVLKTRFQT